MRRPSLGVLLLPCLLAGCPNYQALSAGGTGCRPREISISKVEKGWGHHTWTAICSGRVYGCALVATGKDSAQSSCTLREDSYTPVSTVSAPAPRKADVSRGYDETKKLRFVRAKFTLPPKNSLAFAAAPETAPGKVQVALAMPLLEVLNDCARLTVRVNAVPIPVADVRAEKQGTAHVIKGVLELADFAPIYKSYPQLSVQACAGELMLSESDMTGLQKFVVMTRELEDELGARDAAAPSQPEPGADAGAR